MTGSDTHGDWKPKVNEAEFFDNFKKNSYSKTIIKRHPNPVMFEYAEKNSVVSYNYPLHLRVYSWLCAIKNFVTGAFWYVYDGITRVLWCGELNKLYDELAAVRRERDEALFKAEMKDALLKVYEGKDAKAFDGGEPIDKDDLHTPFKDFFDAPAQSKPRKRKTKKAATKKKSRRRTR